MNEILRSTNTPYTNKEFEEEHGPNTCTQAGWDPPTDVLFQDGEITLSWEIDNLVLGWNVTVGYFFLYSLEEGEPIPITKAEFEEIREDPSKAHEIYCDFDDKLTDGWEGEEDHLCPIHPGRHICREDYGDYCIGCTKIEPLSEEHENEHN